MILVVIGLAGVGVSAQNRNSNNEFCSENWSNDGKISLKDLRETTLPSGSLTVDGKRNGGIYVRGENRSDILVRACVRTWGNSEEEARAIAKTIRVETSGTVRAEGASEERNWSVSYEILVPRTTNLIAVRIVTNADRD